MRRTAAPKWKSISSRPTTSPQSSTVSCSRPAGAAGQAAAGNGAAARGRAAWGGEGGGPAQLGCPRCLLHQAQHPHRQGSWPARWQDRRRARHGWAQANHGRAPDSSREGELPRTCDQRLVVHAQLRQDARHLHRVGDKGLAALAALSRVRVVCERQRLTNLPETTTRDGLVAGGVSQSSRCCSPIVNREDGCRAQAAQMRGCLQQGVGGAPHGSTQQRTAVASSADK